MKHSARHTHVLLCQGLIFENDDEAQQRAILGFGVTSGVILIGALTLSLLNMIRRALKRTSRELLFPKSALSSLSNENKLEIFQIFSESQARQNGNVPRESLARLAPGQIVEIMGSEGKQFDCDDHQEFEQHMYQLRVKSVELDQIRATGLHSPTTTSQKAKEDLQRLTAHHHRSFNENTQLK
jgi:hypothetical protein